MSPTQKAARKPAGARARASKRIHARLAENDRLVKRVGSSLEVAQKDLGKLGGSVGTGVTDLRKNLTRLLRDARRDATKLSNATRKDLERLQKDVAAAAKPKRGKAARKTAAKKPAAKRTTAKKTRSASKARSTSTAKATKSRGTAKSKSRAKASKARSTRAGR
jgi:hypothetical protein